MRNLPEIINDFLNFNQTNQTLNLNRKLLSPNSHTNEGINELNKPSGVQSTFSRFKESKFEKTKHQESLQKLIMSNFSHMKSMLGHISVDDNTVINPVPIYCLCYSEDDELFFTGDNNGLIKIWSTRTGALVDIFQYHEKPVNDMLHYDNYLISCSEDQSVIIWDVEALQMAKMYNFDESIVRIVNYEYFLNGENHHILIIGAQSGKIYFIDIDSERKNNFNEDSDIYPVKFYLDKRIFEKHDFKRNKNMKQASLVANSKCGILVSGFHDGLMCVWDIQTIVDDSVKRKKFIHEFEKYVLFLQFVHSSIIQFVEFGSNNEYFMTGSVDGTVLIWLIRRAVIARIREDILMNNQKAFEFPIYNIFTLSESEDRTRCSVNVVLWTKKSNYVVAIISSKQRKRAMQDKTNGQNYINGMTRNNNNNNTNINHSNDNNPQWSPHNEMHSAKRSSSLIVYSLSQNKIIKKYNENSGFNCHDECFVLEAHPIYEDIVLTISGMNQIVLFNFINGQVVKQFNETNFFFTNITQNVLASEGKFSNKGDSFVISTFLGFVSVYSIYSNNSYSTTYMNQFVSKEFEDQNEYSITPTISSIFPNNVNMYNLPYIVPQPYSKFKLDQIEKMKKILNTKYNITNNEIIYQYTKNNSVTYFKNYNDRRIECEKEFKTFLQAEQDNMNYHLQEESVSLHSEEDEINNEDISYRSEWDREENVIDENNVNNDLSEEDRMVIEYNRQNISDNSNNNNNINNIGGNYNLRSRHLPIANGSNRNNTNANQRHQLNRNSNNQNRPTQQNENRIHTRAYERNANATNRIGNNNNGQTLRLRRRLRLRRGNQISSLNNQREINDNNNQQESNSDIEYEKAINSIGRKKKENKMINDEMEVDSEEDKIKEDNDDYNNKEEKIQMDNEKEEKETTKEILERLGNEGEEHECYFCGFISKKTFGPFYYSQIKNNVKYDKIDDNNEIEFYLDMNCFLTFNDFIILKNKNIDIIKTIEEVIKQKKICFRCNSPYATKKCTDYQCKRYFHGNYCLGKLCIDYSTISKTENTFTQCLECYKKNFEEELEVTNKTQVKINMTNAPKNLFLGERISLAGYFPQKDEEVYFILQAYEVFFRHYFEYIIYELPSGNDIFWWKSQQYNNNNNIFNYNLPFLCKIINIEYDFLSAKSILFLKKLYGQKFLMEKMKIIIRMKIQISLTGEILTLIFFENEQPDFLIRRKAYEAATDNYNANIKDQIQPIIQILLDEEIYSAKVISNKPREKNDSFKESLFETLMIKFEESDEVMLISYWDVYLSSFKVENEQLKILQDIFLKDLCDLINNNPLETKIFYDIVDELKDNAENYYNIVPVPMYLRLIRERLKNYYYLTTESIKFDLNLILDNSMKYNQANSQIVKNAKGMIEKFLKILENEVNFYNSIEYKNENNKEVKNVQPQLITRKRKRMERELGIEALQIAGEDLKNNQRALRTRKVPAIEVSNSKNAKSKKKQTTGTNNNITNNNNNSSSFIVPKEKQEQEMNNTQKPIRIELQNNNSKIDKANKQNETIISKKPIANEIFNNNLPNKVSPDNKKQQSKFTLKNNGIFISINNEDIPKKQEKEEIQTQNIIMFNDKEKQIKEQNQQNAEVTMKITIPKYEASSIKNTPHSPNNIKNNVILFNDNMKSDEIATNIINEEINKAINEDKEMILQHCHNIISIPKTIEDRKPITEKKGDNVKKSHLIFNVCPNARMLPENEVVTMKAKGKRGRKKKNKTKNNNQKEFKSYEMEMEENGEEFGNKDKNYNNINANERNPQISFTFKKSNNNHQTFSIKK